ncbi:cytochrome b-c1 complex subunit 8 [Diprion similis]|uniref:cytochrome b-c1 complex subunit 8 n=1 Tax=Diprion similis TaxID=362088 RepID=UPI001EF85140|nr:cytochrome b-c1 complex subunit 8 [Diprion similis]XP_046747494.1 cytochrome b-c1 complex subunit 8 [Diprion similis]
MGKQFGTLYKLRGIVFYRLSPYEQRAFAGAISQGVPNTFRRIKENMFTMGIPFLTAYLVYDWVEKEYARLQRKNPKDYENDV